MSNQNQPHDVVGAITWLKRWAEGMEAYGNGLAVDFANHGLRHYDGTTWNGLAGWDHEDMIDVNLY